jgi:GntR family transcriptional regulator
MLVTIDLESEIPLYVQLRHRIVEGIASRRLKHGEALPSVRQFAADLGINMHTVNKTYHLLKKEGYIVIHKRKGVLIAPSGLMKDKNHESRLETQLRPMIAEAVCKGISREAILSLCKKIHRQMKGGKNDA